ncbi:MAG TPA: hypothetical protein VGX28_09480 [Frankiaceae bacterium]|jgi:phage protein D|nr:hypothetical protein [Frankiaceae bacterium]
MPTMLLLEIDGTEVTVEELEALIELRVEEATAEADALTLVARLEATPEGEWCSLLDPLATPRTPVAVALTRDDVTYRFDGYSSEATWEVDSQGASRITVKALDRVAELDAEERTVAWPGVSDSDIASAIFGTYGLTPDVEDTAAAAEPDVHVVMQRATDWAFVRALADKWGYAAYLESDEPGVVTGHFHPLDPLADPQGELSLAYGGHGPRATVRADLLAGERVTARRLPPLSASVAQGDADGTDEAQGANALGGQVATLLAPTDVFGEVEPAEAATSVARRTAYSVTLTAEIDTDESGLLVRARRPLLVRGLGETLSGRYLVDKVQHVVTMSSHKQQISLRRNALGVSGDEPFGGGGLLGGLL